MAIGVSFTGNEAYAKPARNANYTQVLDKDWQKVFGLIKGQSDPVAQKLLTWVYVTETSLPVDVREVMAFVKNNPDWPRLSVFRQTVEQDIGKASLSPHEVADWFRSNPPVTADGMAAFMEALLSLGAYDEATAAISVFWRDAELEKDELRSLYARYAKYLSVTANAGRLDNLLWNSRYGEAEDMFQYLPSSLKVLAQARVALGRQSSNAGSALNNVPVEYRNDQGLLFDRMRWKRRRDESYLGLDILASIKQKLLRPEFWWKEQNILSRRAIEQGRYRDAYNIIKTHDLVPGTGADFVQAEWLLGWLSLRHLGKYNDAYLYFDRMYENVRSALSRSQAAYWAAEAAEKAG